MWKFEDEYYKKMYELQSKYLLEGADSDIVLNEKQIEAYKKMMNGKSIFLTGPGGVGKTKLIKMFSEEFSGKKCIGLTSTTGTSALLIGGTTLHSYTGIKLGNATAPVLVTQILKKPYLRKRWKDLEVLIIDEVSMLTPILFDKLEEIARTVRRSDKPFGGIQLILTGDFCFSGDTNILLANGCMKLAKHIKVGDKLLGDDGTVRNVTKTIQGFGNLYKISMPRGGDDFTVTENHILCLKYCKHGFIKWLQSKDVWVVYFWYKNNIVSKTFSICNSTKENAYSKAIEFVNTLENDIIEITVKEYMLLPYSTRRDLCCYKVGISEWPMFSRSNLSIHPWLLGAWLGGGHSDGKGFSNIDKECIDEFTQYLTNMNCRVQKSTDYSCRYLIKDLTDGKRSSFKTELYKYNLIDNKHIPDEYMYSSVNDRLNILAGLLDTDGSLTKNTYQISQSREHLSKQICFLARSLGFSCSHIGGDIHLIPCRIKRKQASKIINRQYDPLLMKMTITPLDKGSFYGFETDGNRRFLLGDFTVTHNCQLPTIEGDKFCFQSKTWNNCVNEVVYLTEIVRQTDPEFQEVLNKVRMGIVDSSVVETLSTRVGKELVNDFGIKPTKLFPLKVNVEQINEEELNNLGDVEFRRYNMKITIYPEVKNKQYALEKFRKNNVAPEELDLAIGAQVMLTFNIDLQEGLANGSRGVVTDFVDDFPKVTFLNGVSRVIDYNIWEVEENGQSIMRAIQVPLRVAYAITIHKCCNENTIIYTEHGIKKISKAVADLVGQQDCFTNHDTSFCVYGKTGLHTATQVYKGGIEDTIKITTSLGYTLEGSYRHPLLTYNGMEEWKKLPDIKIGDYMVLRNNLYCFGKNINTEPFRMHDINDCTIYQIPDYVDDMLCYIIGLLIGDGCYSVKIVYPIEFCVSKDILEIRDMFCEYFYTLFGVECSVYDYPDKSTYKLMNNSKHIRSFLEWCGLEFVTAENKTVPWVVFENTKTAQIQCLKGLYDADGGVNNSCVHYTTISKQLSVDIQNLLLNIGIISSIRKMGGKSRQKYKPAYRVHITGYQAHLFYQLVGFSDHVKQHKLTNKYKDYNCMITKSNICDIPKGNNLIRELSDEIYLKHGVKNRCNILTKNCSTLISRLVNNKTKLRYNHLVYLCQNIENIEQYGYPGKQINYLNNNNLFFDKIVSIEKSKSQLYDLYIPNDHTFIGNGFVNHNCQGATLDYAAIDLENIFEHGQSYVALSRVTSIEGLSILGVDWDKVKAHPEATRYYKLLEMGEKV
jgi:intein/homing endonuclease